MKPADLFVPWQGAVWPLPAVDPLQDPTALIEAQLVDVWLDAVTGIAGVLLELRTALYCESNTGLIVANDVGEIRWSAESRDSNRTAWSVIAPEVKVVEYRGSRGCSLTMALYPDAELFVASRGLNFYNLDLSTIGDTPPDYEGDWTFVRSSMAEWQSEGLVVSASSMPGDRT